MQVTAAEFGSDVLVSISDDRSFAVWDVAAGTMLHRYGCLRKGLYMVCVCVSCGRCNACLECLPLGGGGACPNEHASVCLCVDGCVYARLRVHCTLLTSTHGQYDKIVASKHTDFFHVHCAHQYTHTHAHTRTFHRARCPCRSCIESPVPFLCLHIDDAARKIAVGAGNGVVKLFSLEGGYRCLGNAKSGFILIDLRTLLLAGFILIDT